MTLLQILILALVQGFAELLPVSSSAHVVVAEKLMGLDPSLPQMTLLLVMLHTGTMFAVIAYFWKQWKPAYFSSAAAFRNFALHIVWATAATAIVGEALKKVIEHHLFKGAGKAEIELLFSRLDLVAPALAAAGVLIIVAGLVDRREVEERPLSLGQSGAIGVVQGLALPFRGFSRSGTTISAGMLAGVGREQAERFSFALAVVLTPAVVAMEGSRYLKAAHAAQAAGAPVDLHGVLVYCLIGAALSFVSGLVALRWLSSWLEAGKWYWFGVYCLAASVVVYWFHTRGF